jgi:hypothetical protein
VQLHIAASRRIEKTLKRLLLLRAVSVAYAFAVNFFIRIIIYSTGIENVPSNVHNHLILSLSKSQRNFTHQYPSRFCSSKFQLPFAVRDHQNESRLSLHSSFKCPSKRGIFRYAERVTTSKPLCEKISHSYVLYNKCYSTINNIYFPIRQTSTFILPESSHQSNHKPKIP